MKKLVIVGNWKMNKTFYEAQEFLKEYQKLWKTEKAKISSEITAGIAAPFTAMRAFEGVKGLDLVVQNISEHKSGAYTGEISAAMVLELGAKMVILGHSERRQYYHETDAIVNVKMHQAISQNLVPIVCVGETLEQYNANQTKKVIENQIKASLAGLKDYSKVIIAYEPIWAIGTGKVATPETAQEVCAFIRSITSKDLVIQYGGSVSPENVATLMAQPDINGALVGGASLSAASFIKLLTLGQ